MTVFYGCILWLYSMAVQWHDHIAHWTVVQHDVITNGSYTAPLYCTAAAAAARLYDMAVATPVGVDTQCEYRPALLLSIVNC